MYSLETGIHIDEIRKGLNVGESRISIEQLNSIWDQISFQANDSDFGLHFGEESQGFPGGNILLAVMMNCATLGNAMEKLARYHGLTTDFIRLQSKRQGDYVHFSLTLAYPEIPLARHYSEAILCGLARMLQLLSGGRVHIAQVSFDHARPNNITEHQRIFGCPLLFEQPVNSLAIRYEDLSIPIFLANQELLTRLEQFAEELLDRLDSSSPWAERVTYLINKVLQCGEKPTLNTIARQLAVSTRYLQNKLKEEETTYQEILDQLRKEAALSYLKKPDITFYDIAFLLGFSDQSAFNHAFKRWTGTSPREFNRD